MPYDLVEYPFADGLDEGTDPRRTPKFLAVNNYAWSKRGRLEKRAGYELLGNTVVVDAPTVVTGVTVTAGGTGYSSLFFVTGTGGGGTGFVGIATASGGVVTGVTIQAAGWGYTTAPTMDFSAGGGTGAAATAAITPTPAPVALTQSYTLRQSPQGQLQVTDGNAIYARRDTQWAPIGKIPAVNVTLQGTPIKAVSTLDITSLSQDYQNFFLNACGPYYVWTPGNLNLHEGSNGCFVESAASGVPVPTNNGVNTATNGKAVLSQVVTDGSHYVWKFVYDATAGTGAVVFNYLDCTDAHQPQELLSYGFPSNAAQIAIDGFFDCFWDAPRNRLVAAYRRHGDANITITDWTWNPLSGLTPGFWSGPNTVNSAVSISGGPGFTMMAIGVSVSAGGKIRVAWGYQETGGGGHTIVKVVDVGGALTQLFSAAKLTGTDSIANVSVIDGPSNGYFVAFTSRDWGITASSPTIDCVRCFSLDFSGVLLSGTITNSATLMSRLYRQDDHPHALVLINASPAYAVMDLYPGGGDVPPVLETPGVVLSYLNPRIAGRVTNGQLVNTIRGQTTLMTALPLGTDRWLMPITQAPEPGQSVIMMLQKAFVTYHSPIAPPVAQWTSQVYPTGVPTVVATTVHEVNFLAPPVIVAIDTVSSGGGLSAGNYGWIATYARFNDDGSITESQPSAAVVATVAANDGAALAVTTYAFGGIQPSASAKQRFSIFLYRTQVNQPDAGYFRTTTLATDAGDNLTENNSVVIGDGHSDVSIAGNPQLYTDGGVFENVCPSACTIAARVRDRVYLGGTPDGFTVYYSDPVTNTGTANYHDEQTIVIDDDGPITGIAQLDANVFLFKDSAVYVVFGTEGSNTGNGSTLSVATSIPTGGVGCISAKSIVETPQGLMFQSHRGIELLDRSLQLTFIGEPVKDESAGQTVVASVLAPAAYQVRFYLSTWKTLVLSTLNGEWSVFGYGGRPTATMSDATNINGIVYWCGNGSLMRETPSAYADNGTVIIGSFQSGWIGLGELAGYHRFHTMQLLGTYFDRSSISIGLCADYSTSPMQTTAWTDVEILAIPGFDSNRLQLELSPVNQRAQTISVIVFDTGPQDGAFTAGIAWDAFTFEIRTLPGKYRNLPPAATR